MRLPDSKIQLGAKKIPTNFSNDPFNNPKIQTEGSAPQQNPFGDFGNFAGNEAVQNMAGNLIKDQVTKQAASYTAGLSFDLVRPYFNVDDVYILKKLRLIFLPFLQKGDWKSNGEEDYMNSKSEMEDYRKDQQEIDHFNVDMYIPLISLVTLTQVIGLYHGISSAFDPTILEYLVGKGLFIWT
mmetsp:Transcript_9087/g.10283  ORF Transcript_9087/g.10283 Transcript_9087/m.10283 type:complete len:183 (+) Transcript_9087:39-587(+)